MREVIAEQPDFGDFDFQEERIITEAHWIQMIQSNRAAAWWVDVLERGYFEYRDNEGSLCKLVLDEKDQNAFHQIDWIHQDYINYNKRTGVSRYLETTQNLSRELKKLGISFNKGLNKTPRKDIVENGKKTKRSIWLFSSLDLLRNEWEQMTGNKQWSEAIDLDQNVIETLTQTLPPGKVDTLDDEWNKISKKIVERKERKTI